MATKKFFVSLVAILISGALYSCGVASIHEVSEGTSISKQELMNTPIGTTEETILAKFGEPSRTTYMKVNNKKEDVWFYCWKRGTSGSILFGLAGGTSIKAKCATFIFRDDKLVSKGIGKGANADMTPTIKVQKEEIIKHENGNSGLN